MQERLTRQIAHAVAAMTLAPKHDIEDGGMEELLGKLAESEFSMTAQPWGVVVVVQVRSYASVVYVFLILLQL